MTLFPSYSYKINPSISPKYMSSIKESNFEIHWSPLPVTNGGLHLELMDVNSKHVKRINLGFNTAFTDPVGRKNPKFIESVSSGPGSEHI